MATKTKSAVKHLVVTTAHKGVFYGQGDPDSLKDKQITIKDARMCVYWSSSVKSVIGLASGGPDRSCKISPAAPSVLLTDVTGIFECSEEAVKAWEKQPWG